MHPVKLYLVRVFSVFDILYEEGQPHFNLNDPEELQNTQHVAS